MTDLDVPFKLAPGDAKIVPSMFIPSACPICGGNFEIPWDRSFRAHVRKDHADEIGRAAPLDNRATTSDQWREFVRVGADSSRLRIVFLDWPFTVSTIDAGRLRIEWARDGRAVPVNEGGKE